MSDHTARGLIPTRNFVATETTDYAGSNRLLRVVGEVGVAPGTNASLAEVVPQGENPRRLLLDLLLQGAGPGADPQWVKVKVFERPLNVRREIANVDIRFGHDIAIALDVTEVTH